MKQLTDCKGEPLPIFGKGVVLNCDVERGAVPFDSVWNLKIMMLVDISTGSTDIPVPAAGQFYLLRSAKSSLLLGRPISIYSSRKGGEAAYLEFLILKKGKGTKELCSLEKNDEIELIGPLGNSFPKPKAGDKICIVGGGIGVAPVAGFASTLTEKSYDFFASFKSGSYGLDYIKAAELTITTDDGSVGIHGMLPAALTAQTLKEKGYTVLYACGPTPMLAYLKKICEEAKVQSYLSMENRMACGVGACLGCTITTTEGNKRCCKDGPVFKGEILQFEQPKHKAIFGMAGQGADLNLICQ